jgi:hypothetical protein
MRTLIALLALGSVACGPSAATLREVRGSTYDAPFPTVWNAVTEEVRRKYPNIRVEDPLRGEVLSEWRVIQIGEGEGQTGSGASAFAQQRSEAGGRIAPGMVSNMATPALLFRVMVNVRGLSKTGPWRISVDGEAAEYTPGMAVLTPFRHGLPDEPPWVETRIASLTLAIHDRLKAHASKTAPIAAEDLGTKVHGTTAWGHLADRDAVALIGAVHRAAVGRDARALRATMSDEFTFAAGADGSAETGAALFAADPSKMRALARALEDGCAMQGVDQIVCPEQGKDARARFQKVGRAWKFAGFTAD